MNPVTLLATKPNFRPLVSVAKPSANLPAVVSTWAGVKPAAALIAEPLPTVPKTCVAPPMTPSRSAKLTPSSVSSSNVTCTITASISTWAGCTSICVITRSIVLSTCS